MAFSDFDLRTALERFGLTDRLDVSMFADTPAVEPSAFLTPWLARFTRVAVGVNSELARTVYLIGPVLAEATYHAGEGVNVLPGVTIDVDRERGLNGYCDYVITRSPELFYLRGPIAAVVEAKREDLNAGLGQCVAGMVGIREFNVRDGTPLPAVFGAVTSGTNWRFMKLERDTVFIDATEYYLSQVGKIVGILAHIARG